jgi:hypothetical protein
MRVGVSERFVTMDMSVRFTRRIVSAVLVLVMLVVNMLILVF